MYHQLRYLQTLNSISAEKNSTIVFPVPIDIISKLMGVRGQQQATVSAPVGQQPSSLAIPEKEGV